MSRVSMLRRAAAGLAYASTVTLSVAAMAVITLLGGCADMSGIVPRALLREPAARDVVRDVVPVVEAEWWRAYGDAQLDQLVAAALASNPNLAVTQARLQRARAAAETAGAALWPQGTLGFDFTRQRYTATGAVPPALAGETADNATLQLSGSWEIDFFGRNRSALNAALGGEQAARADEAAARVVLAANVARTWFQIARIDAQLVVARRTLAQREETLRLVRDRVDAGLDTRLELRQAESGLPEARQQMEALQEQATLSRNALTALVGEGNMPAQRASAEFPAIKSGASGAAVVPADLLGRRADIAAARWRVEAAARDIDSAKAQFYPNVNLVAFIGLSSLGLDRLIGADSRQYGIGPAIRLPLFDTGRLRGNLRARTADYDAAVESYNQAVLDAVRDAADQLASAQSIARQQVEQRAAQQAAEDAYDIARQRYQAGLGNYLNVLAAETAVLNQRRLGVDLQARAVDTDVQLMRALGGGYVAEPVQRTAAQTR